jgi:hypothetical protein
MVPFITFICVLESETTEKKVFQLKNVRFFLFQVFNLRFFTKFLFYYSVCIRIRIQTFFRIRIQPKKSDYFGFGSTTLAPGLTTNQSIKLRKILPTHEQSTVSPVNQWKKTPNFITISTFFFFSTFFPLHTNDTLGNENIDF